jgi:hypothetical protein
MGGDELRWAALNYVGRGELRWAAMTCVERR